jgi:hypothetical protein
MTTHENYWRGATDADHEQDLHVIPTNDLREHACSRHCWCGPTEDDEALGLFVHHSLDQRERYETGELKPQ